MNGIVSLELEVLLLKASSVASVFDFLNNGQGKGKGTR